MPLNIEERDSQIIDFYLNQRWSYKQIGDYFNITKERVRQILRKNGITVRRAETEIIDMVNSGAKSIYQIALTLGYSKHTIRNHLKVNGVNLPMKINEDIEDSFVGTVYGNWKVLSRVENKGVSLRYLCNCNLCNEQYIVRKANLVSGYSTKCYHCGLKNRQYRNKNH